MLVAAFISTSRGHFRWLRVRDETVCGADTQMSVNNLQEVRK